MCYLKIKLLIPLERSVTKFALEIETFLCIEKATIFLNARSNTNLSIWDTLKQFHQIKEKLNVQKMTKEKLKRTTFSRRLRTKDMSEKKNKEMK